MNLTSKKVLKHTKSASPATVICFRQDELRIYICLGTGTLKRYTLQKKKFSIKDFFNNCLQIPTVLRIWSHLLKKSLMKIFIFCAMLFLG